MPNARGGRAIARDVAAGLLVIGAVLLVVFLSGRGGMPEQGDEETRPVLPIARTPVVQRPRPVWRPMRPEGGQEEPPAEKPKPEAVGATPEEAADGRALRLLREQEDRRARKATEELRRLHKYATFVPSRDLQAFRFLLGKFEAASRARRAPDPAEHEGLFFNRVFFAAGRWGDLPELRRSWIYLFRAMGCDLEPETEASLVDLLADLFQRGVEETRAIETAVFGAPLEGGDPRIWEAGPPSLSVCGEVWRIRNQACLALYDEFILRLGWILPLQDYERVMEFFELFNLRTSR